MLDIASISGIAALIGVIIGVVITAEEVRAILRERQTALVMNLYKDFGGKEYQSAWQKVMTSEFKDYIDFGNYGLDLAWQVVMLFEGIGVLAKRKLVDISLVDDLISGPIIDTWERMEPIVDGYRKQFSQPQFCEWFEYLYNEMQKRQKTLRPARA